MAQFLRPDSNVTQTSFTGGFAAIDEATASDTDFAYGANNVAAVLEVGLSNPAATPDPAGTSTVRYRIAKTNNGTVDGGGNAVTVTGAVYQGGTLIQSDSARTTSGTWTGFSFTFTHGSITDWTDVRLRFTTSASGGGPTARRGGAVSWTEVEAPDAAPQALVLTADPASFSLVGVAALVRKASVITAAPAAFNAVGVDGGFAKGYKLAADAGAYTLTGNDATLTAAANPNKFLTADFGSYTFTGVAAGVLHAARLLAEVQAFAVTGNLIDLRPGRRLLAEVRAFSVTGVNATLLPARRLTAETGALTLTGISADLIKFGGGAETLVADAGSYTLGLVAADLNFNRKLLASGTAYTLTGIDAGSRQSRVLVASTRSYQYLGVAANLVYSGQPPQQQANKLRYQFVVLDPLQATVNPGLLGDQVSYYVKDFFRIF